MLLFRIPKEQSRLNAILRVGQEEHSPRKDFGNRDSSPSWGDRSLAKARGGVAP